MQAGAPRPDSRVCFWWEPTMDVPDTALGVWLADSGAGGTSGAGAVCPGLALSSRGPCEAKQEQVVTQTSLLLSELSPLGSGWVSEGLGKWSWRSRRDLLGADEMIMDSGKEGDDHLRLLLSLKPWIIPNANPGACSQQIRLLRASLHCLKASSAQGAVPCLSQVFYIFLGLFHAWSYNYAWGKKNPPVSQRVSGLISSFWWTQHVDGMLSECWVLSGRQVPGANFAS